MLKLVQTYFGSGMLGRMMMAILLFILAVLLGWFLKKFLSTVGRNILAKTKTELDDKILTMFLPYIKWLAIIIGLYLASEQIGAGLKAAEKLPLQILSYVNGAIYVALIVALASLVIRIASVSIQHIVSERAHGTSSRDHEAMLLLLRRIVNILVAIFALISIFTRFGIDVSSLLVFLGGGSLAIALASQDTLSNMIAGFSIMLDRPFRVGDRIRLPSGEIGDVYEIGVRSTKVLDADHNLIISPNADLIKTKLVNFSYPHEQTRVIVEVNVIYGSDVERVRNILLELARRHPLVLKDPPPEVFLTALVESGLTLQLVARTNDFRHKFQTETSLREQVYAALVKSGIEISFLQRVGQVSKASNARPQNPQKRKTIRR